MLSCEFSSRRNLAWVLACARIAGEACHILRTDQKNESAVPIDYVEHVNRAIDHIVRNLAESLRLEEVSEAAGFSPFHFHRVFKSLLGETLNQFVKRLRLERALYLMSHAPNRSLTDVALDCGFSSSSDFSRSFKQCYGAAPSVFDLETFRNSRREEFERVLSSQEGGHRFHDAAGRPERRRLRGAASRAARAHRGLHPRPRSLPRGCRASRL